MDYSLLVGVDPTTNQLVIGLIDYLRKFTLDKRLEMLIKQTITSAQGPMPTILTPDLYRERFLFQMDSYFPLVPDQWYDSLAEHVEAWRVAPVQST
ncbi:1-phosphatidylinositol 3-phosphate 5-kinase [Fasciola gigantica]|nr:1-phosphatidylinositol 3-phosphate 5-kinase [Fasciola gigantica]